MNSWINDLPVLKEEAKALDPAIILVTKDGWFWKVIAYVLALFHVLNKNIFLDFYATTFGPIQAYPTIWTTSDVRKIMIHEAEHTRQCRKLALGMSPWLGLPLMAVLYLFVPIPFGFAWFRYKFELGASQKYWTWLFNNGATMDEVMEEAKWFAKNVSSSSYGWAIPYSYVSKRLTSLVGDALLRSKDV